MEVWRNKATGEVVVAPARNEWMNNHHWLGALMSDGEVVIWRQGGLTEAHIRLLIAAHEASL